jgi:hypothetical protein
MAVLICLSVVILNVIMLNVPNNPFMLYANTLSLDKSVYVLSVVKLSDVMVSVVMLKVIMLRVVAPVSNHIFIMWPAL